MTAKKELIEVALPLEAINKASVREKSIRHGHLSTLCLWSARRPLAAARAVIFAQMVDDPSAHPDIFPTEKKQEKERQRLFRIIEELVKWENTTNETVLQQARDEIWQSWRYTCAENADHPRAKELFDCYKLPAFHDPFAGGGAGRQARQPGRNRPRTLLPSLHPMRAQEARNRSHGLPGTALAGDHPAGARGLNSGQAGHR